MTNLEKYLKQIEEIFSDAKVMCSDQSLLYLSQQLAGKAQDLTDYVYEKWEKEGQVPKGFVKKRKFNITF